ncbi:MAG: UDP-3-O-acyl-N-acetylglucosamine deacetylase [Pyramidobacter sp.]|nr:UDP-3-O-acyl-N-acetylglucosamine deacetylase [Pyramidobacter sp.]
MSRKTLKSEAHFSGVGLHSGRKTSVTIKPGESGSGYCVLMGNELFKLSDAQRCGDGRGTVLTFPRGKLMTVEHMLGALRGLGVDDVVICPEGEEIPLLDGSALPFCREFEAAGFVEQSGEPEPIFISSPTAVTSEDEKKAVIALPSDRLRFTYVIEYGDNAISTQTATVIPTLENFSDELGQCRTFCLYEEVEQMRKLGLGLGGTVETALIVKGHELLTPGGLRRPDEFVRHKILDMMGDLSLLGRPVIGHFFGIRAGHAMHLKLVDKISREQQYESQ